MSPYKLSLFPVLGGHSHGSPAERGDEVLQGRLGWSRGHCQAIVAVIKMFYIKRKTIKIEQER